MFICFVFNDINVYLLFMYKFIDFYFDELILDESGISEKRRICFFCCKVFFNFFNVIMVKFCGYVFCFKCVC